ncbi:HAD-IA family hydrolase [Tautonia sociabilis]|uniref:Haloacid dehalogenase n=1 Tax=Tautonia sociabilis TaxID=2080755 RepID=A0A432MIC2_9BACT|nr:HAD-IA family hydrolase [Tautonia sociabilis]RUL86948.1 haloacid dehalogenase [Tautonia sociabilis]
MHDKPTLFFDIGGVILTNAWDTACRKRAAERFGFDYQEFQTRHEMSKTALETGRITLATYLHRTVFHRPRHFSMDEFQEFMYSQSQPLEESLEWIRSLAARDNCHLFSLNNESRELHEYRVRTFRLNRIFRGFLTSCYLGRVKPDDEMYSAALGIASCSRTRAIFIDDRALNVEAAVAAGFQAVRFTGIEPLREFLQEHGIDS